MMFIVMYIILNDNLTSDNDTYYINMSFKDVIYVTINITYFGSIYEERLFVCFVLFCFVCLVEISQTTMPLVTFLGYHWQALDE
jgi:hypothetical protein